jgi:hypothetical protein
MRYTNNYHLPEPLVQALMLDNHVLAGDISVTSLIKPPLMRVLEQRHGDEIVEDVSDLVWVTLGSSVHAIIEAHRRGNWLTEETLTADAEGWRISGTCDLLESDGTLTDYKVTSVYSFLMGDKPEWEAQLNLYAWLYRQNGFTPRRLQIVALLRDWQSRKAEYERDYPQCAVLVKPIRLWSPLNGREYLLERVRLHQAAEGMPIKDIPLCSPEERWEKETVYAVKKKGNKTAVSGGLCQTMEQAQKVAASKSYPCEIEVRPGEPVRCKRYCRVAHLCPFGREWAKMPGRIVV